MNAQEFYEANKTNVVNVPRPEHSEDASGWAGVRRASEARFIAKDCLVMTLSDTFDFAEKFARLKGEHPVPAPETQPQGDNAELVRMAEKLLEWMPIYSKGSSGNIRQTNLRAAIEKFKVEHPEPAKGGTE